MLGRGALICFYPLSPVPQCCAVFPMVISSICSVSYVNSAQWSHFSKVSTVLDGLFKFCALIMNTLKLCKHHRNNLFMCCFNVKEWAYSSQCFFMLFPEVCSF